MERTTLADRLDEKIAGFCLVSGALLMIPNTYFEYADGTQFSAGVFGLLVYALLIPGLIGIARLFRESAPRFSVATSLIATLGCVAGATFSTALLHEWAAREAGASEAMMTAIMDVTEERVFPVLLTIGILFPIALLSLSVGLFRAGVVPRWIAVLLGVGAVLFPAGHIGSIQLLQHFAETLLLIPMVWIGVRFLTGERPVNIVIPSTA